MATSDNLSKETSVPGRVIFNFGLFFAGMTIICALLGWMVTYRIAGLTEENQEALQQYSESLVARNEEASKTELESLTRQLASAKLRADAEKEAREGLRKKLIETKKQLALLQVELKTIKGGSNSEVPVKPAVESTTATDDGSGRTETNLTGKDDASVSSSPPAALPSEPQEKSEEFSPLSEESPSGKISADDETGNGNIPEALPSKAAENAIEIRSESSGISNIPTTDGDIPQPENQRTSTENLQEETITED